MMFDNDSAPITRTVLYIPDEIYACAVLYAYKKPVHAALRSKQVAFKAPMLFCTSHATQGRIILGGDC